jgi:hypothetical protein
VCGWVNITPVLATVPLMRIPGRPQIVQTQCKSGRGFVERNPTGMLDGPIPLGRNAKRAALCP